MKRFSNSFIIPLLVIFFVFVYNEYLVYFHVMFKCNWPLSTNGHHNSNNVHQFLNVMLISDTHLLGSRNGHWFDKLRREWQQHRAFQTARTYLRPDYIVILGDLTDEGKWCSDQEWEYYEKRAKELFHIDKSENSATSSELLVIVGNHDVGFHYNINARKIERFNKSFNNQFVQLHHSTKRDHIHFVLLNSMSMENDGCQFCKTTQRQLKQLNETLKCIRFFSEASRTNNDLNEKTKAECDDRYKHLKQVKYTQPILLTHYPLYRKSDLDCPLEIDSEKYVTNENLAFKPNYDCLSKESTNQLIEMLNPRLAFDGHTHYSCFNEKHGFPEYTVPSFSWRNIKTPSMLLLQVNRNTHMVSKCFLPSEVDVINLYICLVIFLSVYIAFNIFLCCCKNSNSDYNLIKSKGRKIS